MNKLLFVLVSIVIFNSACNKRQHNDRYEFKLDQIQEVCLDNHVFYIQRHKDYRNLLSFMVHKLDDHGKPIFCDEVDDKWLLK